ncbi:hypothetical protein PORY_000848 [Pneumocystis oryctolagi]|uniref:Uncharacterized protein n=1 Tax=Pneumocystis oryctolagi TaxID=42067 RepID=A0ACB7CEC2_9ASCO|nr:hypothetical protein PORY_000848 [Pneumocystis oryctolagi]
MKPPTPHSTHRPHARPAARGGHGGRGGRAARAVQRRPARPPRATRAARATRATRVVIEPHRHAGVFVARGKEDYLVTRNLVPGEDRGQSGGVPRVEPVQVEAGGGYFGGSGRDLYGAGGAGALPGGGHSGGIVISIKANCIDSTVDAATVFAREVKKLQEEKIKPQEQLTLEPYEVMRLFWLI